ncbi:hypothetical protein THAOC_34180 [Thalassiosira oceanica]|uniref:Uncharacterized protein n=1 Tax=Thalassiosira oceanica TaxID=159749 RepID=K0R3W1_THAOC|nr:hypothetical protein THAOC_34180 [Thalassiosira oceanica]|eukprot:EJK47125.1 hypothetical protein THAOC_34180 [Thalassiosira oceanica]
MRGDLAGPQMKQSGAASTSAKRRRRVGKNSGGRDEKDVAWQRARNDVGNVCRKDDRLTMFDIVAMRRGKAAGLGGEATSAKVGRRGAPPAEVESAGLARGAGWVGAQRARDF